MARLLLVDDDELLREALSLRLLRAGHEVIEAPDGRAAMRLARELPFDLVLTDLIMPDCEGLELIRTLRREQPSLRVIAMSGGGRVGAHDYLALASHLGARRVLAKPFGAGELLDAIDSALAPGPSAS